MSKNDYIDLVLASIRTAETHVETEFRDALDETLATISAEPRYAMMPTPGRIEVVTTAAGVRTFYETSRAGFQPTAARHRSQLASDWYAFYEGVPTRRRVEDGRTYTISTLVLFPRAEDGIVGEFLWERYDEAVGQDPPTVEDGPSYPLPMAAVRNLHLHERYLDALREGRIAAVAELLADDCLWGTRSYLADRHDRPMVQAEGPVAVLDYLESWVSAMPIADVTVLNRLATDWYVFAEELYTVGAEGPTQQEFRLASIYPVNADGRLQGQLGYGTDLQPARRDRWPRGGRPTWSRAEYPDQWLDQVVSSVSR